MKYLFILSLALASQLFAALPSRVLVGYWQNWSPMTLLEVNNAYNVIQVAFATTKAGSDSDMEFNLPYPYTPTSFVADIATLHSQGKSVILSIGGASDPVVLTSPTAVNTFVASMNAIFIQYGDAFDGIDIDFESTSLAVGAWTMSAPSQTQLNIISSIRTLMKDYRTRTGKKMALTMAPENVYLQGGLSAWQAGNVNGGAYLPIIDALRDSIDVLHPQYYNAGGATAGIFAWNNQLYYDTGDPDFLTAMTETLIKGFTLVSGKGAFSGFPSSKVAIGLPANSCPSSAGTGYVKPDSVKLAMQYLRGEITKPAAFHYSLEKSYPDLRGLMTWSINEDADAGCDGLWNFATNAAQSIGASSIWPVRLRTHPPRSLAGFDLLGRRAQ
jgi:chitinase